jgi:hypothetical protein
LSLRLPDDCRPTAASRWRWRGRWLKRNPFGAKALHGLNFTQFPHPGRHPSWAGLSAAGETVDLAERLRGPCFLKPLLPAIVHGRERPGLAFVRQGTCAAPAVEPTPRLAGHGPLLAKAATVAHAGAAALLVFPSGLCHLKFR